MTKAIKAEASRDVDCKEEVSLGLSAKQDGSDYSSSPLLIPARTLGQSMQSHTNLSQISFLGNTSRHLNV